jgi:hypothetical protein
MAGPWLRDDLGNSGVNSFDRIKMPKRMRSMKLYKLAIATSIRLECKHQLTIESISLTV